MVFCYKKKRRHLGEKRRRHVWREVLRGRGVSLFRCLLQKDKLRGVFGDVSVGDIPSYAAFLHEDSASDKHLGYGEGLHCESFTGPGSGLIVRDFGESDGRGISHAPHSFQIRVDSVLPYFYGGAVVHRTIGESVLWVFV